MPILKKIAGKDVKIKPEQIVGIKGAVLWSGSSSTVITLSETILNFDRCIVYCTILGHKYSIIIDSNGTYTSVGSKAAFFTSYYALRLICFRIVVIDNKIIPSVKAENYCVDLKTNGTFAFFDNIEDLIITKVVGYKQ